MVFGVPLGSIFDQFPDFFLIKKPVSFPIDFQTSFLSILQSQHLPDWVLAYTRRSKQKTHVSHFWPHFGCILASKMDAKSFQNASKKPTKNQMNFALNESRKMDPIWGSRGGPTNQLFTPKIQSGTPWAPQEAPEIVFRFVFLWCPTHFQIKQRYVLQLAKPIIDWRTPEYIMKPTKKSDKLS